jgi:hypothetical protein
MRCDECEKQKFEGNRCENIYELFWDNDCFGFKNAKECDDHFNNLSPSDSGNNEDGPKSLFDEEEISNISTMTSVPQTPQLQSSVELNNTISDLLKLLLTQEVEGTDRIMIISELEQVLQSLLTDTQTQSVNVELDTEENGNEKVQTITTTSTLTEMVEEEPTEEVEEDDCKNKR